MGNQGYKLENDHHIVIMGMTESGRIDLMHLKSVPRALGAEHIEEDLDMVVRTLNQFAPDIIIADRGLNTSPTIEWSVVKTALNRHRKIVAI